MLSPQLFALKDSSGNLRSDLASLSEPQLRLALAQLIEGLERLDEIASEFEELQRDWRSGSVGAQEGKSATALERLAPTAPEEVTESYFEHFQWSDKNGEVVFLRQMDKESLIKGIEKSWAMTQRFSALSGFLASESQRVLQGEWLQAEGLKSESAPTPRAPRP